MYKLISKSKNKKRLLIVGVVCWGGNKKERPRAVVLAVLVVIRVGFEPTTPSLKGMCSTS